VGKTGPLYDVVSGGNKERNQGRGYMEISPRHVFGKKQGVLENRGKLVLGRIVSRKLMADENLAP